MTRYEFEHAVGVHDLSNERLKAALQRGGSGERIGRLMAEDQERRTLEALKAKWRQED